MPREAAFRLLPDELDRLGRLTLLAVVGLGVVDTVAMNQTPLVAPENLGIVALGCVFLVLMLAASDRLEHLSRPWRAGYFAVQLLLAGALFWLQARLGSLGVAWIVGEAADGHEAVERARTLRPDIVLMDLRMPRLVGVEATESDPYQADPWHRRL